MKRTPSRYDTIQLGDTLRLLDSQYAGLTSLVDLIRKKKELDARYADELEKLVHSFDVISKTNGVDNLVQHFLVLFAEEISLRKASIQALTEELDAVELTEPPSESDPHPVKVETLIQDLVESTDDHEICFTTAKQSIPKLQTWFEQLSIKIVADDMIAELSDFKMPTEEIKYRRSISRQRKAATRLADWYDQSMPILLEKHHVRLEHVHKLAERTSKEYITLTTNLATSNSALLERVKAFSPLQTTALGRVMGEKESLSSQLHQAVYHNYMTDGAVSTFFLGNNSLAISLLDNKMEGLKLLRSSQPDDLYFLEKASRPLETCFKLERMGFEVFNYRKALSIYGKDTILALTYLEFANIDPLFPISEQIIRQFSKGLSRKFMPQVMQEAAESMKRSPVPINMKLVRHLFLDYDMSDVCEILTGNNAAKKILLDIARKWDFDKDALLPEGVVRAVQESSPLIKLF